jgi:hypothetical protein
MAKNTTLSRKTGTGLHKNEGFTAPTRRQDQSGDGADFAFNGQMGNGVNREDGHYNGRHAGNAFGETMRENYGSGPRSAKTLREPQDHGPSVTRDAFKQAPATASEGHNVGKSTGVPKIKNSDSIYFGK